MAFARVLSALGAPRPLCVQLGGWMSIDGSASTEPLLLRKAQTLAVALSMFCHTVASTESVACGAPAAAGIGGGGAPPHCGGGVTAAAAAGRLHRRHQSDLPVELLAKVHAHAAHTPHTCRTRAGCPHTPSTSTAASCMCSTCTPGSHRCTEVPSSWCSWSTVASHNFQTAHCICECVH